MKEIVFSQLRKLTHHPYVELVQRGNAAIEAALSILPAGSALLIPAEGGWLSYRSLPRQLQLETAEVNCIDAKIDIADLHQKFLTKRYAAFLYQNPGGYFAEQPMEEIYKICRENNCLVILDVSGSLGTGLSDGNYADILVGSFGRWKLVNAGKGGFISAKEEKTWKKLDIDPLLDEKTISIIEEKIRQLPQRIGFLLKKRKRIIQDLQAYRILYPGDLGFVVIVRFTANAEKENNKTTSRFELSPRESHKTTSRFELSPRESHKTTSRFELSPKESHKTTSRFELSPKESIINYCKKNGLEWTECPRYIRLNSKAISIEVKRL